MVKLLQSQQKSDMALLSKMNFNILTLTKLITRSELPLNITAFLFYSNTCRQFVRTVLSPKSRLINADVHLGPQL